MKKKMKQVSAHACVYYGGAIIYGVWVRAYVGNYKMATAKSRILQPLPPSQRRKLLPAPRQILHPVQPALRHLNRRPTQEELSRPPQN